MPYRLHGEKESKAWRRWNGLKGRQKLNEKRSSGAKYEARQQQKRKALFRLSFHRQLQQQQHELNSSRHIQK